MKIDEFNKIIENSLQMEKDIKESFTIEEMEEIHEYIEERSDYSYDVKKSISVAILEKSLDGVYKNVEQLEKGASIMQNAIKASDPVSFIIIGIMNIVGMAGLLALLSY